MKLTPFGETVRLMRLKYGLSLKAMAEAMGISSAYLSAMEFGDKRLSQKHIDAAVNFLKNYCDRSQLQQLREAAAQTQESLEIDGLSPDARGHMAMFARRLQEGAAPTPAILSWLAGTKE